VTNAPGYARPCIPRKRFVCASGLAGQELQWICRYCGGVKTSETVITPAVVRIIQDEIVLDIQRPE
jgi:hypothetical protein